MPMYPISVIIATIAAIGTGDASANFNPVGGYNEKKSSSVFLAGLLVLGLTAVSHAQGTQQVMPGSPKAVAGQQTVRGNPSTGTGVATGSGPLSQPVGPATSSWNPQWQNTRPLQQQPFGR